MPERRDFHDLKSQNRRATWGLMTAFFLLLAVLGATISLSIGAGVAGVVAGIVISGGLAFVSYVSSDKLALSSMGAMPADEQQYARLHNIVEGLAISAGIPKPRVFVVDDPAPNAFATGKNYERAAVAVTTGLLEKMRRDELEGVLAHELAHIRNYDIRVMTVAVATAGAIALIVDIFWRMMYFGGGGRRRDSNDGGNPLMIVGLVVVAILAPLAAAMLKAAVSRRRESLADATAVEITRYPTGLRSALEKLDADSTVVRRTSHATSHLWIETPDDHVEGHKGRWFNNMFDTHPPMAERINILRQMEGLGPYEGPTSTPA